MMMEGFMQLMHQQVLGMMLRLQDLQNQRLEQISLAAHMEPPKATTAGNAEDSR